MSGQREAADGQIDASVEETAMRESYAAFLSTLENREVQVDYSSVERFAADVTAGGKQQAFNMSEREIILALESRSDSKGR